METLHLFDAPASPPARRFRLLHTSDWHLGQHFMGRTRQAEHQAFCAWLVAQVRLHAVDAVVIAGDVFDTGTPPSYAREQYNDFVLALRDTGARLVVLGGNHDSAAMLGESRGLLAALDAQVIPASAEDASDQVVVLRHRDGKPGAVLCAIPYLRPRDLLRSEGGQSAQEKQRSLQQAIQAHYATVYELAEARRQTLRADLPIIATGHLTTVGASASESVREIYVGALEAFPTNAFPPADYIALGHIHRPQAVGGEEHIRYCGSPIALAFDESAQQKQVLLVDFEGASLRSVEPLLIPVFQPLASLKGSLAELAETLPERAATLEADVRLWLEVVVTQDDYLADLQPRINALCEGLSVDVLRVRRERKNLAPGLQGDASETLDELDPHDVFERRLSSESLDDELAGRLRDMHREVLSTLSETD
ncbi:exonuclease subunit SbcD [Pseudomonas matsuisoli]|uniref:Nuclease SbcCD subunit D n=1 Tax=Pseudomonas matsuisoli TaxID=1515666 RepID=A0A917PK65_9PSED|nr:exonuclease subunit SbcD [Pseudomonas matsuisoli]GGJ82480.1 nuclease SbcCD subunit D [Pseudomonas matsuisoli]